MKNKKLSDKKLAVIIILFISFNAITSRYWNQTPQVKLDVEATDSSTYVFLGKYARLGNDSPRNVGVGIMTLQR